MTDKPLFASDAERTMETARLNDLARTAPKTVNATWLATSGVAALIAEAASLQHRDVWVESEHVPVDVREVELHVEKWLSR